MYLQVEHSKGLFIIAACQISASKISCFRNFSLPCEFVLCFNRLLIIKTSINGKMEFFSYAEKPQTKNINKLKETFIMTKNDVIKNVIQLIIKTVLFDSKHYIDRIIAAIFDTERTLKYQISEHYRILVTNRNEFI